MASIQYGTPDSGGDYPESLSSPRPDPASRFFEFTPDTQKIGPRRAALGDASIHEFRFRRDYLATVAVRHLRPSQLASALALKDWLTGGGTVRVVTGDSDGNVYVCKLKPGTDPTITNDDDRRQHFSFSCELRSSTAILVNYGTATL